jgi:biopolymer transport protein ExbD
MNLSRHDPETEMDMNMTPMIDVVFLLIIFFMIITDMTQKDLEELQLPVAIYAVPDKPNPDEKRPIVNVPIEGRWIVSGEDYYDPERDDGKADPYLDFKTWLATVARSMKKAPVNENSPAGPRNPLVPDEPLLVRADQSTEFKHVQKIMELLGYQGIQIWKVQFAVAEPGEDDKLGK